MAPFPRGADRGYAARRRRRLRGRVSRGGLRQCLQVGVCARVPLWGVSFAVSESQRPDDLVCFVQRRRSGACLAWCRGFRHCYVAVSKSRGRGADVPWLVRWCVGALLGVGVVDGHPRGGAFQCCEGRQVLGAVPLPVARPPEQAARVPRPVCPGCGRCGRAGRPSTGPTACALAGRRCSLWGWRKGVPGGSAFHRCGGRLVSGAVPPPAARPPERAARVLRPVCPGCGRCGRVDPAPAPQRAPLRAGVARCGGRGRASPGGVPSTMVRGAWCQALSLPRPRSSSGACSQGSATRVSRVRTMRACGPSTGPTACALAGRRCSLWGWRKGVPGGGAFHRCEGRLVSGAVPPPAALVLRSVQPGFRDPSVPGAVDAGVWTQHRSHSVRPCGPTLLAVGVAEWRPREGCLPPL